MESNEQKHKKNSLAPLSKSMSLENFRTWLRDLSSSLDPETLLEEVKEAVLSGIETSGSLGKDQSVLISKGIMMLAHERHYLVAESVFDEGWRPMIMDFAHCIQKEYSCKENSEIALAGLAASAYYRSLKAARKLNALLEKTEIGMTGVNLMTAVSKEIDRAERQYLSAIETLRSRRQPQMNVKIQTKTAFFNENQTINCTPQSYAKPNDPQ